MRGEIGNYEKCREGCRHTFHRLAYGLPSATAEPSGQTKDGRSRNAQRGRTDMAKAKNITLSRKSGDTKIRRVQVRDEKISITLYIDKTNALRLAKEINKRWGKK